jgi:hypothetical protein
MDNAMSRYVGPTAHPLCKHLYTLVICIPDDMPQVREGSVVHDQQQRRPSAAYDNSCMPRRAQLTWL